MKLPDLKRVRQVRLLPLVIFAGVALLLLKGVGIMTTGGYVLVGAEQAQAEGAGHGEAAAEGEGEGAELTMAAEPTLTDDSPVLDDGVPTLPLRGETAAEGGHGEPAGEGEHDAKVAEAGHGEPAAGEHGEVPAAASPEAPCPVIKTQQVAAAEEAEKPKSEEADHIEGFDFGKQAKDCIVDPGVNADGDALPVIKDGAGNIVPLAEVEGAALSQNQILERLSVRRAELDQRETEIEMRMALVEAAEKRIDERTSALEALEARINAMVDEKRTLEESQFVGVVAMYETMKPKDAAAIFDKLDMVVLLRVARAVNPRKMAPIMAKMDPVKAMELTAGLAVDQVEPTIDMAPSGAVAELPQILGQ